MRQVGLVREGVGVAVQHGGEAGEEAGAETKGWNHDLARFGWGLVLAFVRQTCGS